MFWKDKNKPPYNIEKIAKGDFLDKSRDASASQFLFSWMEKIPRKVMLGTCFVLYEDEQYIYWGEPEFRGSIFTGEKVVDVFYRTPQKELLALFPNYKKVDGTVVRVALQDAIKKGVKEYKNVRVDWGVFRVSFQEKNLSISTPCMVTIINEEGVQQEKKERYRVVLDKNNLDLVSIKKL